MTAQRRPTRADVPPDGPAACDLCGNPVKANPRGGRPREWCSRECRETSAAFSVLEKWMGHVSERATPRAWVRLRGRLGGIATLRAWNRGVHVRAVLPPTT